MTRLNTLGNAQTRTGSRLSFPLFIERLRPRRKAISRLILAAIVCFVSVGESSAASVFPAFMPGQEPTLESKISGTDWTKIRGANFIPSYASNTYDMWRNYDRDTFDHDLQLVSTVGYNSVRLWLNYDAFAELGAKMVERVDDALRLCAKHHLRAVIVLTDSCGIRPRQDAKWIPAGEAYDQFQASTRFTPEQKAFMAVLFKNYVRGFGANTLIPVGADTPFMALLWQNWQPTPGNNRLGPDWYPQLEKYVDAIVAKLKDNPNVLLWDVMNEPEFASEGFLSATVLITPEMETIRDAFLRHFHDHLKQRFPNEVLGVGWASLDNAEKYSDLADVVTFHVYGDSAHLRESIGKAQAVSDKAHKKILITETLANWDFGKPDFGRLATDEAQAAHYRDVLPILTNSPIGWIGWGMVISHDFDPFTDIFYPNGIPRPAALVLQESLRTPRPSN